MNDSRRSSASSAFWRLASDSRATHSVAVAKATRCPARQALIEIAIARCVLPVPGGPSRITFCSGPFGGPFGVTWNAIEDDHINGSVSIEGYNGFWFGFLGNHVNGSVRLNNNTLEDPDGNEYPSNVIHGTLECVCNSPDAQFGDAGGEENL